MPRRFTPFYQSLANQGMRQTNNNIGNMNQPPRMNNPQYSTLNNNMNQGGGNVMGGGGTFNPDTGEGNMGGGSGPDINPNQNPYGTGEAAIPPPEGYASWSDYYQGNPGQMMYDNALDELNEGGFFDEEEIVPPGSWDLDLGGLNLGGMFDYGFGGMTEQIGQNLQDYQDYQIAQDSGFDLNNDGIVDIFDMQLIDPNTMTPQEFEQFYASMQNYIQGEIVGGHDSNILLEQAFPTGQAPQFTGGGGQGGQAARKLYYPGTSGGFAGVGSGIGGGSTLQDLLKGLG